MPRASWMAGWCLVLLLVAAPALVRAQAGPRDASDLAKPLQNPAVDLISVPLQHSFDFEVGRDDGFRYTLNVQPIVYQDDTYDPLQSLFLSPKAPFHGLIWDLGPIVLLPTSSDSPLGGEKWGIGPTGVDDRADVGHTFLQPFVSHTFSSAVTVAANTEEQWTVPVQIGVSTVLNLGPQTVSLGPNTRYWADGPSSASEWGLRFVMTFLSPKGKKP